MIIKVDKFVQENLPKVLEGKSALRCFFTTYREVRNFRPGDVNTDKPGLSIRVSQGGSQSMATLIPILVGLNPEPMIEEARAQLATSIARSGIPTDDNGHFLLVAYAGLTAFDETIDFLCGVRARCPVATIVIVTCDCQLGEKKRLLLPHVENGTIDFVTAGYGCGGRDEMAAILNGVLEGWPPART